MANSPNVLQPYWLILLPLDVPALAASLLLWHPSSQRWNYMGERNGRWILPENARLPRNIHGSFTCRKSMTWDRRLYFPSEGRRAENFFALKNPTVSGGFEPANLGTKGQHATSRPPKPLRSDLPKELVVLYPGPRKIRCKSRELQICVIWRPSQKIWWFKTSVILANIDWQFSTFRRSSVTLHAMARSPTRVISL